MNELHAAYNCYLFLAVYVPYLDPDNSSVNVTTSPATLM
jgi:hypothetical protein